MLPLRRCDRPFGVLQVLDRRDGGSYWLADLDRGAALVELALAALDARAETVKGYRPHASRTRR